MKKILLLWLAATPLIYSCQQSDDYDNLPAPVAAFISQYWPNPDIVGYTPEEGGGCTVSVKNSITATFDSDYSWTRISGNGLPLPENLLFDQLPEKLYDYIESAEALREVFVITRTPRIYEVSLLNSVLTYTISAETITQQYSS